MDAVPAGFGETADPFGSWLQAELEILPRFPHRDSFPAAKGLINRFLQDGLDYQDLRIALFWLGFGLLDVPIPEEPTMSLVPLCKDLDTYLEIATELGYDPNASVHLRPVTRLQMQPEIGRATSSSSRCNTLSVGSSSSSATLDAHTGLRVPFEPQARRSSRFRDAAEESGCASRDSRSCTSEQRAAQDSRWSSDDLSGGRCLPCHSEQSALYNSTLQDDEISLEAGWGVTSRHDTSDESLAGCHGRALPEAVREDENEEEQRQKLAFCKSRSHSMRRKDVAAPPYYYVDTTVSEEENEESARQIGHSSTKVEAPSDDIDVPRHGGATSSQAAVLGVESEQVELSHKVKLLYAGGWSDSSSSEGHSTPPTPPVPASSSTGDGSSLQSLQAGGLDMDHVEQFTVSFISDVQMHEDLEETSCLCTFCLDDMNVGEELCRLPCMHTFHRRCVHAWLERDRRCMLCRLDITRPRG